MLEFVVPNGRQLAGAEFADIPNRAAAAGEPVILHRREYRGGHPDQASRDPRRGAPTGMAVTDAAACAGSDAGLPLFAAMNWTAIRALVDNVLDCESLSLAIVRRVATISLPPSPLVHGRFTP